MSGPRWWSQPFAPEGSAASEGIKRQLGTPKMDPLAVLVRETAQNSWDARYEDARVDFTIDITSPGRKGLDRWRESLLPEPHGAGAFGLDEQLREETTVLLTISDRGTTGLGGPLRADRAATETPDFVNLVRNIGEPRDKTFGGGTYGFGKGVLFTASTVGAVLIRTRCVWQGQPQTRLIVVALGHSFDRDGRRHTGRHWWGRVHDEIPDPLLDGEAEEVAEHLMLPRMAEDELGTDIVVIGARLGSGQAESDSEVEPVRSVREAGDYVASAMLWHLWPLLLPQYNGRFPLGCRVSVDGQQIHVPDPRQVVRLRPFVDAYQAVEAGQAHLIRRQRPATDLGLFAARRHMAPVRRERTDVAAPFQGNGHHCVLLREPRLVVRYMPGPLFPDDMVHYGAVFLADRVLDPIFAAAEPPTHDDWVHDSLPERTQAHIVRYTLGRVKERLDEFAGMADPEDMSGASQPPLGALSNRLGVLIPTVSGSGADELGGSSGSGGSGSGIGRRLARIVDGPRLVRSGNDARIVATFQVDQTTRSITITVRPLVALDHGSEADPPAGADQPEVVEWRSDDGTAITPGARLVVAPNDPRRWVAVIRPAVGAATRIRLDVEEGR